MSLPLRWGDVMGGGTKQQKKIQLHEFNRAREEDVKAVLRGRRTAQTNDGSKRRNTFPPRSDAGRRVNSPTMSSFSGLGSRIPSFDKAEGRNNQ